jgi:2-polyprenyl-3-methyl-5-hydroxy-6-metoxy-1,4-benzoquinol methylase
MPGVLSGYLHKKRNGLVRRYVTGDVLDIGCGSATIAEFLEPSQKYVGIEIQDAYITYLSGRFPQHTFVCPNVDRELLSLGDAESDPVLMVVVTEHLFTTERLIWEVRKHMKPNSQLGTTTPTIHGSAIQRVGSPFGLFAREAVGHDGGRYGHTSLSNLLARCPVLALLHKHFQPAAKPLCIATASLPPLQA